MNPRTLLQDAIKAVPAVRYALGVGGLLAVVAIAGSFGISARVAVVGAISVILGMLILLLFASATGLPGAKRNVPALILTWFALVYFMAMSTALLGSVFFRYPLDLGYWLADRSPVVDGDQNQRASARLSVHIEYTGDFYRETFGFTPSAKNIRFYVLLMPEKLRSRAESHKIFTALRFPVTSNVLLMQEDRANMSWALEYLHEAPGGYLEKDFEPGTYYIAAAFLAASISKFEAGHTEDVRLWPGLTGGGASTDFTKVGLVGGESKSIQIILNDDDGWG